MRRSWAKKMSASLLRFVEKSGQKRYYLLPVNRAAVPCSDGRGFDLYKRGKDKVYVWQERIAQLPEGAVERVL